MRRQPYLRPIPASVIAIVASFVATPVSAQAISIEARPIDAMDTRCGEVGDKAGIGFTC